MMMINFQLSN